MAVSDQKTRDPNGSCVFETLGWKNWDVSSCLLNVTTEFWSIIPAGEWFRKVVSTRLARKSWVLDFNWLPAQCVKVNAVSAGQQ